jgi:isopentenyldiphosphate isomerase
VNQKTRAPSPRPATTDPQDELFDVLDEHGNHTGITRPRGLVHRDGDWHPALHIWVAGVSRDGVPFVLFQRRSMTKDTWPGALDVAIGGHLRSGETLEDAVREAEEEIGLSVSLSDLVYIGRRFTDSSHSGVIDREMQEVFAVRSKHPLSAYRLHPEEVDAVVSVGIDDARRLFSGEAAEVAAVECSRAGDLRTRTVSVHEFVQASGSYLFDSLDALERVVAGVPVTPFELRVPRAPE